VTEATAAAAAADQMSGTFLPPAPPSRADTLPANFPVITDTMYAAPSPGRLFLANMSFGGPTSPYLIILDESCTPVFYRQMPGACTDFKLQPTGRLTYFDGMQGKFYAMDTSYAIVDSFACGNGYPTDGHELRLLPNGHALLMGYDPQTVDMRPIDVNADSAATVIGLIVQELDENKNVAFQWRSWDHFQITDATHEDLRINEIDYVHGNAIELDRDGNLMISSRNMDEITKISRETGDVIWRWGGKNNQFTFIDDPVGFSHQHAIRRIANGHVTLFDNGNFHPTPYSRGVEYELDEVNKTARQVWEFRNTPDSYAIAMGYVQRLSNGSTLISWGTSKPDIIEVAPDGSKVMELSLPMWVFNYRAYRFAWPPEIPEIPTTISLSPNQPNPFHGTTTLTLRLAADANVSLKVYDVAGREVMKVLDNVRYDLGVWPIQVDLRPLKSGLYFCRLVTGGHVETRKIVLAK
jgi:hypothetical protein